METKKTQKTNTKKTPTTSAKKVKLNINYIDFIAKVITEKLQKASKEKLRDLYLNTVRVKSYSNIKRVNKRVQRDSLKSLLTQELQKRKIDPKEFYKTCDSIVVKISERGHSNNYIELE